MHSTCSTSSGPRGKCTLLPKKVMGGLFKPSHQHSLLSITPHAVVHCLHYLTLSNTTKSLRDLGIYMYHIVLNTPLAMNSSGSSRRGSGCIFKSFSPNMPTSHTVVWLYYFHSQFTISHLPEKCLSHFLKGERWSGLIYLCLHHTHSQSGSYVCKL